MRRIIILSVFAVGVAALAGGIWRYGYVQALEQLQQRGQSDLRLASDRLTRNLQRFQELAVLTAEHPMLSGLQDGSAKTALADAYLLEIADRTSALNLLYVDAGGDVLARAHPFVPTDLPASQYFQRAAQGALGSHHDVIDAAGTRVYYFAAPSFGPNGKMRGAVVVMVDVDKIEFEWRGDRPAVFFTDEDGTVFVSNRTEMLLWARNKAGVEMRDMSGAVQSKSVSWISDYELWHIDWGPYLPRRALHIVLPLPVIGLTGEALIDVAPALRIAGLQAIVAAALALAAGAMINLVAHRRRVLALDNARLETRVRLRTAELSEAIEQLQREVSERQDAEAALTRAQAELVQAGKLSALGQMSAGISHELNQPLMAIRSFAENGALFLERGDTDTASGNLTRISELARRMGRIIKNLRAFARNESEAVTTVDMGAIIESALELTQTRRAADGITLFWTAPDGPVAVRGGEVRLGQVMLNLITNACDAMAAQDRRALSITLHQTALRVQVQVADTGPGIEAPDRIFDPFYSTKEVGASEGMGLGLSISYGLVQSFGGDIKGENGENGAIFTLELNAAGAEHTG